MKTKTAYLFGDKGELLGYDGDGRPVYSAPKPNIPFKIIREPFSPELARNAYGLSTIQVRYRDFIKLKLIDQKLLSKFKSNTEYVFNGYKYKITYVMKYDNHYEVLVDEVGIYT